MKPEMAYVTSNEQIMPEVYLTWLESPQIAATARPGQFVMVRCGDGTLLRRPLSVHNRDGNRIALLFAVVGKGTSWLSQRKVNDSIDILGPLGNGFTIYPESKNLLLVAGGIGIVPLRFLADEAIKQGKKVTLLLGAPTTTHLYPPERLPSGIELITTTEDGTTGRQGKVTEIIPEYINQADQVFACGPLSMYRGMYYQRDELLKGRPTQISLEAHMGCGLGICYGCTVKTKNGLKQVCRDGPVFDLDKVCW